MEETKLYTIEEIIKLQEENHIVYILKAVGDLYQFVEDFNDIF